MPRFPKPDVRRNARAIQGAILRRIRIRRLRSVISPADVLTLGNAFSGFMAIAILTDVVQLYDRPLIPGIDTREPGRDRFFVATLLMGIGLVCDALDGIVARKFGGSRLGGDLDTLADATTFVVTPALMLLSAYKHAAFPAFLSASLILLMGLLRLARFNSNPTETETKTFQGLPTPWMAITVALMVLASEFSAQAIPDSFALPFAAVLAFLMMSNVAYPKSKGRTRYVTYLMVASAVVIIAILVFFPARQPNVVRVLFTLVALTIAIAPLLLAHRARQKRKAEAAAVATDDADPAWTPGGAPPKPGAR